MEDNFILSGYGTHVSLAGIEAVFFSTVLPSGRISVENGQELDAQIGSAESTETKQEEKNNPFEIH